MSKTIRVGACRVPDIREDVDSALSWIEKYALRAESEAVSVLCFPECFLQGYLLEGHRRGATRSIYRLPHLKRCSDD